MIEPPEVLVLGPYMRNMDGNPGTAIPRWAWAPSRQASSSSTPCWPTTRIGAMNSVARNPVLQMMQSSSCSLTVAGDDSPLCHLRDRDR